MFQRGDKDHEMKSLVLRLREVQSLPVSLEDISTFREEPGSDDEARYTQRAKVLETSSYWWQMEPNLQDQGHGLIFKYLVRNSKSFAVFYGGSLLWLATIIIIINLSSWALGTG